MKLPNHHYSRFLISVHFDRDFVPDTVEEMMQYCDSFLIGLGRLARKSGRCLYSTFSVNSGIGGFHAHFALSWLPVVGKIIKPDVWANGTICMDVIVELLEQNYFYVDNESEAIKRITHNKPYVTSYVLLQPKDGQFVCGTGFYVHEDFKPSLFERKIGLYCTGTKCLNFKPIEKNNNKSTINRYLLLSASYLILISYLMLSIF